MSQAQFMPAKAPQISSLPRGIELRTIESLPPAERGLPRGGPVVDPAHPDLVTFCLTAPFKPAVALVGDFNGWNPSSHPMQTDGRGFFWLTVRLTGPTHYRFAVTMDGSGKQVTVADPYAREIRWDSAGPEGVLRRGEGLCLARPRAGRRGVAEAAAAGADDLRALRARLQRAEERQPGAVRSLSRREGPARSPRGVGRQRNRADAHYRVPRRELVGVQSRLLHGA